MLGSTVWSNGQLARPVPPYGREDALAENVLNSLLGLHLSEDQFQVSKLPSLEASPATPELIKEPRKLPKNPCILRNTF